MRLPHYYALLLAAALFSCGTKSKPARHADSVTDQTAIATPDTANANTPAETIGNILCIFQDKKDNYWFGTQSTGVYRYDGKTFAHFTLKDGLSGNQVQTIQEDEAGNTWFGTGGFNVSRFDGKTFTTFTGEEKWQSSRHAEGAWKTEAGDLWFYGGGGAYRYDGNVLTYLSLPKTDFDTPYSTGPAKQLGRYGVYVTLKDKKGNLWFGTQGMGVCRYDGKSFTWFTEKGLAGSAVLALFEDQNGNLWFGNNGAGLFRYDGKTLTNVTDEKGLGNPEFKRNGKPGPGTLARIYAINEDDGGGLWIGTVDAGAWHYDGNRFMQYTTKDGLASNAVITIYKDKKGVLWFGTEGEGLFNFNGQFFTKFVFR